MGPIVCKVLVSTLAILKLFVLAVAVPVVRFSPESYRFLVV
jgi:hypothetical protein